MSLASCSYSPLVLASWAAELWPRWLRASNLSCVDRAMRFPQWALEHEIRNSAAPVDQSGGSIALLQRCLILTHKQSGHPWCSLAPGSVPRRDDSRGGTPPQIVKYLSRLDSRDKLCRSVAYGSDFWSWLFLASGNATLAAWTKHIAT